MLKALNPYYKGLTKKELIKLLKLKNESVENNKKYKLDTLVKLVRQCNQAYFNVGLTTQGYANIGHVSEYVISNHIFNDCSHVITNGDYDRVDNGVNYEFKSLVLNEPHELKRPAVVIVLVITAKIKGFYRISEENSKNLIGKQINQNDIIHYGELIKPL